MFRLSKSLLYAGIAAGILAVSGLAAPAYAVDCTVTLANNVGDQISVSALLHATDSGELSEGEALSVTSSGGELSQTLSTDELWYPFQPFTATQANETVSGTISGSDSDESCALLASNAPPEFTNSQRSELEAVNESVRRVSLVYVTARYLCDGGSGNATLCALHFTRASTIMDFAAYLAGRDAAASQSAPFTEVTQPPPILDEDSETHPPDAVSDGFYALTHNTRKIVSLEVAIATTAARANAAYSKHASHWYRVQRNALQQSKQELGAAMLDQATLSQNLSQAIANAGADLTISPTDVAGAESGLPGGGLKQKQVQHLERIGASANDATYTGAAYLMQDPNSFSGTVAGFLANSSYLQSLQTLGQDLMN
jgi:hypothetical protein